MYLIISWFYSLGKISGIVPEPKLKNWIFQRDPGRDSPYGFSFSVFLFFSFSVFQFCLRNYSGIFPETFRNICAETEKLKNWKTEFSREIQEEILHMDSVFQFFCFSVFQFCLRNCSGKFPQTFRNICGETEKLKNRKTEKLNFPEKSRKRFSIWIQFFSFSVFQFFCFAYGTIPENFRRHFGIFAEKLKDRKTEKQKNWKTEFSREIQEEILHMDSVFLFFSFSVFQFCLRNYSGTFPQSCRNICGETQRQKNRKTEFSREIQEEILHMDSVFQFFCFSVLWQNRAGGTG